MVRKVKLSIRIDEYKYKKLVDYVKTNNLKLSSVLRAAITKYLQEKGVVRCQY